MKVTTLTVDCGGTGIKASVLDKSGKVLIDFPYLKTPYPLSPSKLIGIIQDFVKADLRIKRVTVGLPGMIRNGKVVVIPHYINTNGPRSAVDPNLKKAWYGFDMQSVLQKRLKKLKADNTKVQFVLCDQISTAAFSERYKKLNAFTGSLVTCAETVKIRNREDLNYYQSRCLLLGYPGVNLRHSAEGYKSNDSVFFLAVHTPKTKSYNVVDVKSGRGEFAGFAIAVCATDQGDEFEVMCPQHVVTSIELTTNLRKYISRRLTVAYFDLTFGDDIVPKYPVAVAFK